MKNLWHSIAPFATDTTGTSCVFASSPCIVYVQDSNGSVSTLRRVMDINASRAFYETVDLPELSYTLGREGEFVNRMAETIGDIVYRAPIMGRMRPQFVVLLDGPVSSLLGTDLESRAQLLAARVGVPVFSVETTGNAWYDRGIAKAYQMILEHIVDAHVNREKKTVNLLGMTELDYPGPSCARRIAEILGQKKLRVISDWGYTDSLPQWKHAASAQVNIVMSVSGLKLARDMESRFGIPYTLISDLDWFDGWVERGSLSPSARVLIIGEQISSNLIRRLLERGGMSHVTCATFFAMDAQLKRDGDVRLKGESDLRELFARGYDLIIGDATFKKFVQGPYAALMHPPVGFGHRDGTELSPAWLHQLGGIIGRSGQDRGI